ncbi:MAG: DMT family transporter [Acidimicrobiales bacterium]
MAATPTEIHAEALALARKATVAMFLAIVSLSAASAIAKNVDLSGQVLSVHRVGWAALLYQVWVLAKRRPITRAQLTAAIPLGICYGLTNVLLFVSLKHTTLANVTIILALQPLPVMAVSNRLFGERVTRRELLLSVLSIGGVGLVVVGSSGRGQWSPWGDLAALGSLAAWATYFVFNKRLRATFDATTLQAAMLPVATVTLAVIAVVSRQPLSPGGPQEWLGILAIIATAGSGHLAISWAAKHIPIAHSSLLTLGQPVFGLLLGALFFSEGVAALQVVGVVVVLATLAAVITRPTAVPASTAGPGSAAGPGSVGPGSTVGPGSAAGPGAAPTSSGAAAEI